MLDNIVKSQFERPFLYKGLMKFIECFISQGVYIGIWQQHVPSFFKCDLWVEIFKFVKNVWYKKKLFFMILKLTIFWRKKNLYKYALQKINKLPTEIIDIKFKKMPKVCIYIFLVKSVMRSFANYFWKKIKKNVQEGFLSVRFYFNFTPKSTPLSFEFLYSHFYHIKPCPKS